MNHAPNGQTPFLSRCGFSLIEIIVALIVISSVAVIGIRSLRPAGQGAQQSSCDLTRELLQNDVQRYVEATGVLPRADLSELVSPEYSGLVLPTCPATGQAYRLDRNGVVGCPAHEPTRSK